MTFDASYLAKCTGMIYVPDKVGFLFHDDPHHMIYETGGSLHRQQITDAETKSLTWTHLFNLPPDTKDICFTRYKAQGRVILTFFLACSKSVSARTQDGRLLWSFSGAFTGMVRDINPRSITVDEKEKNLYVCDSANKCIQIISTDGVYQGNLVEYGQYGLGTPARLKWHNDSDSLLIVHSVDNDNHMSVVKVQSKNVDTSSGWICLKILFYLSASMIILYLLSIL